VNPTIHLTFRYTERDYIRALRSHYATYLNLPLDIPITIAVATIGIYLLNSPTSYWIGFTCITLSSLFALLLIAAFTIIPSLAFRNEPKFRDDYSLTFSPEGIHFRTAHIDSQLQWNLYSSVLIGPHSYLLYYGTRQFTTIPTRIFQSLEQQQEFEQMLMKYVPKTTRKTR
jgi:YcxB-like protein